MHVGDRVRKRSNGDLGRVAAIPSSTPGSVVILQNDDMTVIWPVGDVEIVKPIAEVIAEQEKVVAANMQAAQQAQTEENLQRLESAAAQLRMFKREARGVFRVE